MEVRSRQGLSSCSICVPVLPSSAWTLRILALPLVVEIKIDPTQISGTTTPSQFTRSHPIS